MAEKDPGALKDPDEWVTGEEPMTGAQAPRCRGRHDEDQCHHSRTNSKLT
jgi:hypothetical protein